MTNLEAIKRAITALKNRAQQCEDDIRYAPPEEQRLGIFELMKMGIENDRIAIAVLDELKTKV